MSIKYKPKVRRLTDDEIRRQLALLEAQHGMSSEKFLARYNAGELGHCDAFVRWAGLLAVATRVGLWDKARS
jgi:hypothetical protein